MRNTSQVSVVMVQGVIHQHGTVIQCTTVTEQVSAFCQFCHKRIQKMTGSNLCVVAVRVGKDVTFILNSFCSSTNYICIQQTRSAWHAPDISRTNQISSLPSQHQHCVSGSANMPQKTIHSTCVILQTLD